MPLFQPSNITPSSFAGVGGGTIAVENPIEITWQVNGNVAMTAFQINVNNESGVSVGGSDIVQINNFYPTDNKGNPQYYKYKPANVWADWGLQNGKDYTLQITQYWGGLTDDSHSVKQLSQSAFITRKIPTLSIKTSSGADVSVVETAVQGFQGIYEQEQGDSVDWVRWQLIDNDFGGVVYDTGVVNTQVLSFMAENLQSGKSYTIVCLLQTESGILVEESAEFSVEYELRQIEGQFTLGVANKISNLLQWDKVATVEGDAIQGVSNSTDYSYSDGRLVLGENASVTWSKKNNEELNIRTPWTFAWSAQGGGLTNGVIEKTIKAKTQYSSEITYNPHLTNEQINNYVYSKSTNLFYCVTHYSTTNYLCEITNSDFRQLSIINPYSSIKAVAASSLNNLIAVGGGHDLMFANESTAYNLLIVKDNLVIGEKVLGLSVGGVGGTVISVLFSNDGKYFAVAKTRDLYLYSVSGTTFALVGSIPYATTDNYNVKMSFNKDSTLLAVGGDETAKVYKVSKSSIKELYTFREGSGPYQILFNPKTDVLVANNNQNTVVFSVTEEGAEFIFPLPIYNRVALLGFDESGSALFIEEDKTPIFTQTPTNRETRLHEFYFIGTAREQISKKDFSFKVSDYNGDYKYGTLGGAVGGGKGVCAGCDFTYEIANRLTVNEKYDDMTIYDVVSLESNSNVAITYTDNSILIDEEVETPLEFVLKANIYYLEGKQSHNQRYFEIRSESSTLSLNRDDNVLSVLKDETLICEFTIPQSVNNVTVHLNSDKIYAIFDGNANSINIDTSLYPQESIKSISIYGKQECEYVYVSNETAEWSELFTPSWTESTVFLTNFQFNSLQAGKIEGVAPVVDIYRENLSNGEFLKLYSCGNEVTKLRDFSWITGEHYNYYGYVRIDNKYVSANPFSDSYVCRNQPYYLLLVTEQDKEQPNSYHVVTSFRFGNNMQGGSITNNNTPNFLTNFTEYRTKQPSSRMSKSGTLQALLSNTVRGVYSDTTQQMENLFAISKCRNPMFLKDMKGNLYMVTISAPITQTINTKSAQQEVTVSIPWEEIGSSKGVAIIQIQTNEHWVDDSSLLQNVKLRVDEETGMLIVEYPNNYNSTTFNMQDNLLLANTNANVVEPNLVLSDGAVKLILEE